MQKFGEITKLRDFANSDDVIDMLYTTAETQEILMLHQFRLGRFSEIQLYSKLLSQLPCGKNG